jgi:DNA-binding response OmpR family regulator
MKLRAEIARLRVHITGLEAQLRAVDAEPLPLLPVWATNMKKQQVELISSLVQAYPRTLSDEMLDELLTHLDHAADRDTNLIPVLVSQIRKQIGFEKIITERGRGYRATQALVDLVKPPT